MIYKEIIIIIIFYIFNIVVLTIEIVFAINVMLTAEIVFTEDTLITFKSVVIVLIVRFVFARVLFIVSVIKGD